MTDPNANTEPAPRIAPVERSEATDRQADLLGALGPAAGLNIFRTLANHPKLFRSWIGFGGRLLQGSTLPEWDRELVILRTAARCGSDYEWGQHVGIARLAGVADDEILRAGNFGHAPDRSAWEAVLVRAVDELVVDHCLGADTWQDLADQYEPNQILELTMLAGHYAMLAGMLRSVGVRTEDILPALGEI